jgi:hypothetical protein
VAEFPSTKSKAIPMTSHTANLLIWCALYLVAASGAVNHHIRIVKAFDQIGKPTLDQIGVRSDRQMRSIEDDVNVVGANSKAVQLALQQMKLSKKNMAAAVAKYPDLAATLLQKEDHLDSRAMSFILQGALQKLVPTPAPIGKHTDAALENDVKQVEETVLDVETTALENDAKQVDTHIKALLFALKQLKLSKKNMAEAVAKHPDLAAILLQKQKHLKSSAMPLTLQEMLRKALSKIIRTPAPTPPGV